MIDAKEAARIALEAGRGYDKDFDEIRYICFSERDREVYKHTAAVLLKLFFIIYPG